MNPLRLWSAGGRPHLTAIAFAAIALALPLPAASAVPVPAPRWLCALAVTPDGVWYLDCSDWDRLQDALPDEAVPVWRVPVWGKPMHAGRAEELLRAVLCREARGCEIRLATRMLQG